MVTITATYDGSLRCTATHAPSGATMPTDAPVDNHGRGEAFSPTDLVATALGTCILTTMAIAAARLGTRIDGATIAVEKLMAAAPTRRIGALNVAITMPAGIAPEHHAALIRAAERCPVTQSLHPDITVGMVWVWG
jgi:putative redox protein